VRCRITGAAFAAWRRTEASAARAAAANVYFDTCVYHLPGIELLFKVVPHENILFGSEMVGAVRGIDPRTGQYYDDTKRYVDALQLSEADRSACIRATRGGYFRGWMRC
jgi:hypothetical protein